MPERQRGNPVRLGPRERAALCEGAAALGVAVDEIAAERFCEFARALELWGGKVNLISCASARELVERHFVDSLAVGPVLAAAEEIADLGSGAGFPGVPLAIVYPEKRMVLIEPRRRRANFLREVGRTLRLGNLEIVERRAEIGPLDEREGPRAAAVCRAVWSDDTALSVAALWVTAAGRFFWMRGPGKRRAEVRRAGQAAPMILERRVCYTIGGREWPIEIFRHR